MARESLAESRVKAALASEPGRAAEDNTAEVETSAPTRGAATQVATPAPAMTTSCFGFMRTV